MIAVVDYGMGNLRSVAKALESAGGQVEVTRDPEALRRADRIVLPGVGAFADGMRNLRDAGLVEALNEEVRGRGKPFLGICLGLQMLADESHENGRHPGLGWIPGVVKKFDPAAGVRVPHVGWNDVRPNSTASLFLRLDGPPVFYFVHSYYLQPRTDEVIAATCTYGGPFVAAVQLDNVVGTQFHPEKSQAAGLSLLANFVSWRP